MAYELKNPTANDVKMNNPDANLVFTVPAGGSIVLTNTQGLAMMAPADDLGLTLVSTSDEPRDNQEAYVVDHAAVREAIANSSLMGLGDDFKPRMAVVEDTKSDSQRLTEVSSELAIEEAKAKVRKELDEKEKKLAELRKSNAEAEKKATEQKAAEAQKKVEAEKK